jgi:hypothetical protein
MTESELKEKIMNLIREFSEDDDNEKYDIFVIITNTEENTHHSYGLGCPACSAECVVDLLENGDFKHLNKNKDKREVH